jgi:hypothetical protein
VSVGGWAGAFNDQQHLIHYMARQSLKGIEQMLLLNNVFRANTGTLVCRYYLLFW